MVQTARWLPGRRIVAVADSSFAAIGLLRGLAPHLAVVTRLRLDACLCEPPPPREPRMRGRPPVKGARLPGLAARLADPATPWRRVTIDGWYGRTERRFDLASGKSEPCDGGENRPTHISSEAPEKHGLTTWTLRPSVLRP